MKPASAARPQRDPAQVFKRLDANADGKLAADEAPEPRREFIAKMIERGDKDGDHLLSLEEFTAVADRALRPKAQPETTPEPEKKPEPAQPDAAKRQKAQKKKLANRPVCSARSTPTAMVELNGTEIGAASTAILKLDKDGDGNITAVEAAAKLKNKKKKPS